MPVPKSGMDMEFAKPHLYIFIFTLTYSSPFFSSSASPPSVVLADGFEPDGAGAAEFGATVAFTVAELWLPEVVVVVAVVWAVAINGNKMAAIRYGVCFIVMYGF